MAINLPDLPTNVTEARSRTDHLADHNRLHLRTRDAVYSSDYSTLQDAVDDAVAKQRPLVIVPGAYILTAPLRIHDTTRVHITAYRATLQAGAAMASLVEFEDCTRCTWYGGWLQIPGAYPVQNAIYVYRTDGQSSNNEIHDVTVEGNFVVGLRVGRQGDNGQCDHHYFSNLEFLAQSYAGTAVWCGPGIYGNCLNHTFVNLKCSGSSTHLMVDQTNCYVTNAFFDSASVVDVFLKTNRFSLRNVRSENALRFLETQGGVTYPLIATFEDIEWHGQDIHADLRWMKLGTPGHVRLANVRLISGVAGSVIYANPLGPLGLTIEGLTTEFDYAAAFSVNAATTRRLQTYLKVTPVTGVLESIQYGS